MFRTSDPAPLYTISDQINEDTQEVVALRYSIKVPERDYASLTVKVKETRPSFTKEDLAIRRQKGLKTFVAFEGFVAKPYSFNGMNGVSATASKAIIFDEEGKTL